MKNTNTNETVEQITKQQDPVEEYFWKRFPNAFILKDIAQTNERIINHVAFLKKFPYNHLYIDSKKHRFIFKKIVNKKTLKLFYPFRLIRRPSDFINMLNEYESNLKLFKMKNEKRRRPRSKIKSFVNNISNQVDKIKNKIDNKNLKIMLKNTKQIKEKHQRHIKIRILNEDIEKLSRKEEYILEIQSKFPGQIEKDKISYDVESDCLEYACEIYENYDDSIEI